MERLFYNIPYFGSYFKDPEPTDFSKFKNNLYFNVFILKEFNIYFDIIKLIIIDYFELFNLTLHFYCAYNDDFLSDGYPHYNYDPKIILDGNIYGEQNKKLSFPNKITGEIVDTNNRRYYNIFLTKSGDIFSSRLSRIYCNIHDYYKMAVSKIIKIITIDHVTICLSKYGKVYVIRTDHEIYKMNLNNVTKISMINDYFMALTNSGDIYKTYLKDVEINANKWIRLSNTINFANSKEDGDLLVLDFVEKDVSEKLKLFGLDESEIIIDIVCLDNCNVFLLKSGNVHIYSVDGYTKIQNFNLLSIIDISGSNKNILLLDKNHNMWYLRNGLDLKKNKSVEIIKINSLTKIIKINYLNGHYIAMDSLLNIYYDYCDIPHLIKNDSELFPKKLNF